MQRMHTLAWVALLAGGLMLAGCGSSKSDGPAVEVTTTADAGPTKDARDPKQVVNDFLDLKRKGDHAEADKVLSEKACDVTRRFHLAIVDIQPGAPIRYEVSSAEMLSGGAHVETTWTYGEGETAQKATILFVLRDDAPGWRIVGVIMKSAEPMAQPIALDFEDEQQIQSFTTPQSAPSGRESSGTAPSGTAATGTQQPSPPATATKPKETTHQ